MVAVSSVGRGSYRAAVTDGLADARDRFFDRPLEATKTYRTPSQINRGYSPPRSEQLSLSLGVESATRMNDSFEAFDIGAATSDYPHSSGLPEDDYAANVWPHGVGGFQQQTTAWFADALGLAADFYERYTDHSLDVLRMNNYALPPGEVDLDTELMGMGEHTEYGIVTILWAYRIAVSRFWAATAAGTT